MAKFVYGMNVSLDGYIDHDKFAPGVELFRHWIEQVGNLTGSLYGRTLYELMRYWDEDDASWDADEKEFAKVWRKQPKWVVSRTLPSVGPNATLINDNIEAAIRALKAQQQGEIDVGGSVLAQSLSALGLIDEYRLYYRPFVLGSGTPFFRGPLPPLRLIANDRIGEDAVRLTYIPA